MKDKKETRARSSRSAITTEAARASSEQIARIDNGQAGEPSLDVHHREISRRDHREISLLTKLNRENPRKVIKCGGP